jgi:tetratricopeptide (TPR) repeat protein
MRFHPLSLQVVAVALACASTTPFAFEMCDDATRRPAFERDFDPMHDAFKKKRIEDLHYYYEGLLRRHAAGNLTDQHLQRAFSVFQCSNARCEPILLEWARNHPGSEAPYLALAVYYRETGYAARGSDFASDTAESQFDVMREAFRKAIAALDKADKVSRKASFSASLRLDMAKADGSLKPRPTEIYRKAIKDVPDTLQVRIRYAEASQPKWGGSMKQLESIIDDARALPEPDRRYIQYVVYQEMASALALMEEHPQSVKLYERSVALCPGLDGALGKLIGAYEKLKDNEHVVAVATRYIERNPRNGWAYSHRGWAELGLKQFDKSYPDFEKSVALGYPDAYLGLAWHHEWGKVVPQDYRKAIEMYLTAERLGVAEGRVRAEKVMKGTGIRMN